MTPLHWGLVATFLPLATALFLVLAPGVRRWGKAAGSVSVAAAGVALFAAGVLFAQQLQGSGVLAHQVTTWLPHGSLAQGVLAHGRFEVGVHLDGVSVPMLLVVCLVAFCVQVFSLGYMADEAPADFGRYFTWQSLFLFAMNTLVVAPNLLQLFLGWELVGLASYLLIGYYWKKPSAARAALKAFWVTKFADMGLVGGLIVLFLHTGGFDWAGSGAVPAVGLVTLLLFLAVMGKSAQFPLHVWLPDAMEGPTPVSALLHAATMVAAGVFLVVRAWPLFEQAPDTQLVMAYVGGFTALFAAIVAVVQTDIKKVLAYSTCSQLGYMVCGLGAGSQAAGFFHLTTHAAFKALLFLAAGSLIHAVHSNELRDMGGLWGKMKVTSVAFIGGALALSGFPLLAGFFSKDLILEVVYEKHLYAPFAALLLAAFLTAFYMGRVMVLALFGAPRGRAAHAHESGPSMLAPLLILLVPAVAAGYFGGTLSGLYGEPQHFHLSAVGLVATALGLSGLGTAYWMFGAPQGGQALRRAFAPVGRLAASGAVDAVYTWGYRRALTSLSAAVAWFDRYIVDGLVNLTAWLTLELGQRLKPLQTGRVQDYVYAIVVALLAMGLYGAFGG